MIPIEGLTITILLASVGILWLRNRHLARREFAARCEAARARLDALASRRDLLAFKLDMGLNVEDDDNEQG